MTTMEIPRVAFWASCKYEDREMRFKIQKITLTTNNQIREILRICKKRMKVGVMRFCLFIVFTFFFRALIREIRF